MMLLSWTATKPAFSKNIRFSVASYNVENLFDMKTAGTEYPEYLPNSPSGWTRAMQSIKVAHTARVIKTLDADIFCLQEVESAQAMEDLKNALTAAHAGYPFSAIADKKPTTVKCAVLSRFPIVEKKEIQVPGKNRRNILWVTIDVNGSPLMIFVNHWKSKSGPESERIPYARALKQTLVRLPRHCDYILAGDFNENYNEFSTISGNKRLNDTAGVTGINQILGTLQTGRLPNLLIDEDALINEPREFPHYNLWLELSQKRRWSILFFGQKGTPDNLILPKSLYDDQGISYLDNSFDKFDADFLFTRGDIFRWQQTNHGRGRHLGRGYSDHLPIFACFSTRPFKKTRCAAFCGKKIKETTIAGLYESKTGAVYLKLSHCAVIFRHGNNAVIKQKNGRAVYIYKAASGLKAGRCYDILVDRLNRHYGNLEITSIKTAADTGTTINPDDFQIDIQDRADLSDPAIRNDIIRPCTGTYKNGFLLTEKGRFALFFSDPGLRPPEKSKIAILRARIICHRKPEIVVERPEQIRRTP